MGPFKGRTKSGSIARRVLVLTLLTMIGIATLSPSRAVADEVMKKAGTTVDFLIGTMIEVPRAALTADQIERVELKVHPLVLELTGKKTTRDGLEGKFSVYHAVAVALVEGAGGEKQFSDRAVSDPTVVALRSKVIPIVTPGIDTAEVDMTIVLVDGRKLHRYIEHAIGSLEAPMSDKALEVKFADLADGILPAPVIRRAMDLCWNVETLANPADIARMCVKGGA